VVQERRLVRGRGCRPGRADQDLRNTL